MDHKADIKKRTLYNRRNSSRKSTNTGTSQGIEPKRGGISDLLFSESGKGHKESGTVREKKFADWLLLYTTGLRASELLSLNWGSFRYNRQGHLYADVIGKGKKPRTIPIKEETKELLFEYRKSLGESIEINTEDTSPLFYALYNRNEPSNKKR